MDPRCEFTCNVCGTICPHNCLPAPGDVFVCSNTACRANNPSNFGVPDDLAKMSTGPVTGPAPRIPTLAEVAHTSRVSNLLFPSLRSKEARIEDDSKQEKKVMDLVDCLRVAPNPSAIDCVFYTPMTPSITEILPGLYIGNIACANNEEMLRRFNITAVISVISQQQMPHPVVAPAQSGAQVQHPLQKLFTVDDRMLIDASDRPYENLIKYFEDACNFIHRHCHPAMYAAVTGSNTTNVPTSTNEEEQQKEKVTTPDVTTPKAGKVLVHCAQGISRSATIVAAYLMWRKRASAANVLTFIKHKRRMVNPNKGFLDQLLIWEKMGYTIWGNKEFGIPCLEYTHLQLRLDNYKSLEMMKQEAMGGFYAA
ncbi:Dual specificity protein phosphatase 26 [Cytospora mali]|uniref:protein-tyrosine-phosphatase n=1 Tax=Cytospora mali TaxID=578113 RepID=A0A194VIG7_CYTMA|nr:Dual specificity protein phosphatase 26 [Valsa mali]